MDKIYNMTIRLNIYCLLHLAVPVPPSFEFGSKRFICFAKVCYVLPLLFSSGIVTKEPFPFNLKIHLFIVIMDVVLLAYLDQGVIFIRYCFH